MRILIVEDSADMRSSMSSLLEAQNHSVIQAVDGRDGWDKWMEFKGSIDAIVTDYEMPGWTGEEMTANIRKHQGVLPIVMHTGNPSFVEDVSLFDFILAKGTLTSDTIKDLIEDIQETIHARKNSSNSK